MSKLHSLFIIAILSLSALGAADPARFDISTNGAIGDGTTLNTKSIQATIDKCAAAGGGVVVIPKGQFLSGAIFLKPGVNLELLEGAVLKGSPNPDDYAVETTRFEGHFETWRIALINAAKTDHLRITGPGTLDGNGPIFWEADSVNGRPRLCFIQDSSDVVVSNVHFFNSASWNLHFYNCSDVTVEKCRFDLPQGTKGPSTDGTDIDSSQNVTIRDCSYYDGDDCICLKGNRYDGLDQTPLSPPVEHIHIIGCTFQRGMGALSFGTEAQKIHDVEFDHSTVTGKMPMLRLKMRTDTSGQDYQNVNVHDITLNGQGVILSFELTHGTRAQFQGPRSKISGISVSDINGTFASFGKIAANRNTDISDISLKNFNVTLRNADLDSTGVTGLTFDNVLINGSPVTTAANP